MPSAPRRAVAPALAPVAAALALAAAMLVGAAGPAAAKGGDRVLTAKDAVLAPPDSPVTRTIGPDQGCQVLLDHGTGDCAFAQTAHGGLAFTVEPGPYPDDVLISRPWVVRVYRESKTVKDGETVALETQAQGNDPGPLYANVAVKVADVTGDGKPELVIGYRSEGTGQILDLDIVSTKADGTPVVLAHDTVYKGTVRIDTDGITAWTPFYKRTDGNCCPTAIDRETIRWRDGAFHVHRVSRTPTKQAKIPPGDLD